ncbi:phospholipid scramblase 4 [Galendromus occidentalis]|uniref:Phospholipid scramblase n=1 Tax=Galendromus occidentalis TaxID=34638 RepID=A0AAJ6QP64_9ACAR|nr:phospholipid scramblase 4 [Galendromus occidentalis]
MAQPTLPEYQSSELHHAAGVDYYGRYLIALIDLDEVHIHESPRRPDAETTFEVYKHDRRPILTGIEENHIMSSFCFFVKGFNISFKNRSDQAVLTMKRPACRCCGIFLPCCCSDELIVESPPGNHVGTVRENWSLGGVSFDILEPRGEPIMKLTSDCCAISASKNLENDVKFKIHDLRTTSEIGEVVHNLDSHSHERRIVNNYCVSFSRALPVHWKALMIGSAILLNFRYFKNPRQPRQVAGEQQG